MSGKYLASVSAAVLGACALTAGCSPEKSLSDRTVHTIGVDMTGDGLEYSGNIGETIAVELPYRAGTGYEWTASGFDTSVVVEAGRDEHPASPEKKVGAAMILTLSFNLVGRGETTVLLERRRAWEKDQPAAESRRVKVTVR